MQRGMALCCLVMFACSGRPGSNSSSSTGGGSASSAGADDAGMTGSSSSSSGSIMLGALGSPCTSAAECTGVTSSPGCESVLVGEMVSHGVCISTACTPGEPCESGAGKCLSNGLVNQCILACFGEGTCPRSGFSCFNAAGVGQLCLPTSRSECSPSTNTGCTGGQGCQRAGPDDVGVCAAACSPELQDCPSTTDGGPAQGCYFAASTPFCSEPANPQPDYAPCSTTNACEIGRTCVQLYDQPRCYFTCNPDGGTCPSGRCQPLFQGHLCVVDEPADAGVDVDAGM